MKNRPQAAAGEQGEQSPRLLLNKRLKAIIATGILPSLSPSALTVLLFAVAHGDFTTCKVFLGAKTVANRQRWHRAGARRGIAELLAVGLLVEVKACTNRQATVYKIALVPELIEGAARRAAAVGAKRRKSDEQKAAEAEAKKLKAKEAAERQGAHGCAPTGLMGESPGGSWVSPEGAHGCAPNLSSSVPSSLKERVGNRPRADAQGDAQQAEQTARLRKLRITQRQRAEAK
jgi:hypothetical protein